LQVWLVAEQAHEHDRPLFSDAQDVHRLTVDVPLSLRDFQGQYERAVPPLPREEVDALGARGAPWSEMNDLIASAAPFGFLIYWKNEAHNIMRLAADTAKGTFYLMGNHTIAERMYRYQSAAMLSAPLHTMIWDSPDGATHFTFDRPSDQFGSFEIPAITAVGLELDQKLADLLDHLGLPVPEQLSHAQQGRPRLFSTTSERATPRERQWPKTQQNG